MINCNSVVTTYEGYYIWEGCWAKDVSFMVGFG